MSGHARLKWAMWLLSAASDVTHRSNVSGAISQQWGQGRCSAGESILAHPYCMLE